MMIYGAFLLRRVVIHPRRWPDRCAYRWCGSDSVVVGPQPLPLLVAVEALVVVGFTRRLPSPFGAPPRAENNRIYILDTVVDPNELPYSVFRPRSS